MKVKALKDFSSTIGISIVEGEVRDLELDAYTLEDWIESGLIEEVKTVRKKKVIADEN